MYTTQSITWDDGEYEEDAATPKDAAMSHVEEGYDNMEENPAGGEENIVMVTNGSSVTYWRVTADEDGDFSAEEISEDAAAKVGK